MPSTLGLLPRFSRFLLCGINSMIIERGIDTVLYSMFREVGYSASEIRGWITHSHLDQSEPHGDAYVIANRIARSLNLDVRKPL